MHLIRLVDEVLGEHQYAVSKIPTYESATPPRRRQLAPASDAKWHFKVQAWLRGSGERCLWGAVGLHRFRLRRQLICSGPRTANGGHAPPLHLHLRPSNTEAVRQVYTALNSP